MAALTLEKIDQTGWLIIAIVGVIAVYEIYENVRPNPDGSPGPLAKSFGIPDPNDTTGDPNSIGDTSSAAYAGNGIFGVLGNIFNKLFGGLPQSIGNNLQNYTPGALMCGDSCVLKGLQGGACGGASSSGC